MKPVKILMVAAPVAAVALSGCASTDPATPEQQLRSQLESEQMKSAELSTSLDKLRAEYEARTSDLQRKDQMLASMQSSPAGGGSLLPPNAKPGECYARVFIPPQYATETETVLKREAAKEVMVSKPEYDWVEKQVLVREATKKLEVIPAKYRWAEERVLVQEASERLEVVPAVYDTVEEKVLVQPAYTTWKKGRGPIERIDEATGEIMCLVEVPAVYNTVKRRVQIAPPKTRKVEVPAVYKTVRKRVLAEPARTVEVEIPAEYQTVRVKQMVQGPQEVVQEIPPEYQTVTKRKLVREGALEWRPILCETNTTPDVIRKLQGSLRNAGYNPGAIDGILGNQTMNAVSRYQRDNGMAEGRLTMSTLRKLGVI